MDVSIVIPAYNEEARLGPTLGAWQQFLGSQPYSAELLVVDDGSRDQTAQVGRAAGVAVLRLERNLGKGGAVRAGMLQATGSVIGYADADMNVHPAHLPRFLERLSGSADVAIGSRALAHYAADEGVGRLLAGAVVQLTRRVVVLPTVRDTQCGFKFFRRGVARSIFERSRICSFAFDIEVLFLARKLGATIVELPVTTTYRANSTFDLRRHLPVFLADIIQIRRNDLAGRYRATS